MAEWQHVEFTSSHKGIKNTSTNGTVLIGYLLNISRRLRRPNMASLVAQTVKRLPAMQETQVQFLGQKDPLEKEMATHSSTLAWKIPWMEEPNRLQSMGLQRVGHD